jgi:general secretion pathway protein F
VADYEYTARDFTGKQVTGLIPAGSQQEALMALSTRQLFPLRVKLAESAQTNLKSAGKGVANKHLAIFYSQLADLLKSGVPLLRSLDLLERQARLPAMKYVLQQVREQVADGTRLFEAMRQHPKVFKDLVISMVRAGEEGGFLEDVLKRVALFTEHQEKIKSEVIGAMIYPSFLLIFGGAVVAALMVYFVPQFEPIFERMRERGGLPAATTVLIAMSEFSQKYWWVALIAIVGGVIGLKKYLDSENGRWQFDKFKIHAYGFGRIAKSLAISRFCRVLGTLLKNGVPILPSLQISKDATANLVLSKEIERAAENISTGKSLARPLAQSGEFPEEVVEMISVGEEANNLEEVLINIADNLEARTNKELSIAVRMLEPMMLLVMAAIVLFVVVALMLPILQSSSIV